MVAVVPSCLPASGNLELTKYLRIDLYLYLYLSFLSARTYTYTDREGVPKAADHLPCQAPSAWQEGQGHHPLLQEHRSRLQDAQDRHHRPLHRQEVPVHQQREHSWSHLPRHRGLDQDEPHRHRSP